MFEVESVRDEKIEISNETFEALGFMVSRAMLMFRFINISNVKPEIRGFELP